MNILDDLQMPFEKRCYDEKANNICKAAPIKEIIEILKQQSRELTKQGRIKEAQKVFDKAWDMENRKRER